MRLFVSIMLGEKMLEEISKTARALRASGVTGRYSRPENYHLTLAFIGEVESTAAAKRAIAGVEAGPLTLRLSRLGNFGDIIWVGLEKNRQLDLLAEKVREALRGEGVGFDRKNFSPHITLIRSAVGNFRAVRVSQCEAVVGKISLMKSEIKDGKRVYTEIFSKELKE